MKGLTKRQKEIVGFIEEFIHNHRYSPSFREIMSHFDYSSLGTVYRHIAALQRKGVLSLDKGCSRSLSLTNAAPVQQTEDQALYLPLIGHLSAGSPIEMFAQSHTVSIPRSLVHAPDRTYAIRALGDTLQDEMIADGDLLIVEARQEAHAGETVIASVNQYEIVVKKYFPEGQYVRLVGSISHPYPMIVREEDLHIQGVLVALIRPY